MYEYKVVEYDMPLFNSTLNAEQGMNAMAKQGWKVVSTSVKHDSDCIFTRLIVTYEREKK